MKPLKGLHKFENHVELASYTDAEMSTLVGVAIGSIAYNSDLEDIFVFNGVIWYRIGSTSEYTQTFTAGDWVAGTPNTLTINNTAHNLGTGFLHVSVFDVNNFKVDLCINVDNVNRK